MNAFLSFPVWIELAKINRNRLIVNILHGNAFFILTPIMQRFYLRIFLYLVVHILAFHEAAHVMKVKFIHSLRFQYLASSKRVLKTGDLEQFTNPYLTVLALLIDLKQDTYSHGNIT